LLRKQQNNKTKKMKNLFTYAALSVVLFATACKKNEAGSEKFDNRSTAAADYSASTLPVTAVTTDITTNTTWDANHVWELNGVITVRSGATLTINAGTFIKSTVNTAGKQNGVLVIAKDGKINAVGTATSPIVFTSRYLLDGVASTVGHPGDFGGLIILGNAKINVGDKLIEGLDDVAKFHYGGSNNADDRGKLQYARIEFAGYKLADNVEVNSLTLGGVGSGTVIDHVQASYGLDDSFEFFGGTVSPTNLVALAADDDQYDFDNGYTGTIQYAIAVADRTATHSGTSPNSDSNGIESDNNAPAESASFNLLPKTHPILVNFSVIGTENLTGISTPGYLNAVRERRGSEVEIYNSIFTGYPKGITFDADANASLSTLADVQAHGFTASKTVAAGAYVDGGGNSFAANPNTNAPTYSTISGALPWFNSPGSPSTLNFATGTANGAITLTSGNWTTGWTKFVF
jgi:hypothetical protein